MNNDDLIFRCRTNNNYHEDSAELMDLFRKCEKSKHISASAPLFHCEFTDYLSNMNQYSQSYCFQLVKRDNGQIVFVCVSNQKQLHFGDHQLLATFTRLLRVEPSQRRQKIAFYGLKCMEDFFKCNESDVVLSYILASNTPSLKLTHTSMNPPLKSINYLDIFVMPTTLNSAKSQISKLSSEETERLWTMDLSHCYHRPILTDLQNIMKMKEYQGTFIAGDVPSGRFSAASVWQPSSAILCDDRPHTKNTYRGPYWLVFNLFQSLKSSSYSSKLNQLLLSSLSHIAAKQGIPYMLCHVDQSSLFNPLCRKQALGVATEVQSHYAVSEHATNLIKQFHGGPIWLDPHDFSSLLYFNAIQRFRLLPKLRSVINYGKKLLL